MQNLFPFSLAVCALLAGGAHAQTPTTSKTDTVATQSTKGFVFQRYEWDASVDASFILPALYQVNTWGGYGYGYLNGSGGYGFSPTSSFSTTRSTRFMVRKNETVRNATNIPVRKGAYRFALQLTGSNNRISNDSIRFNNFAGNNFYYFPTSNNMFSISAGIGYEWQQQVGRFQFLYGYDVSAGTGSNREVGFIQNAQYQKEDVSSKSSNVSIGISPVAGVKFFVHPRFSLSLEGSYTVRYNRNRFETTRSDFSVLTRNATDKGFYYGFTPLSAFNATFHFGKVVKP